jgi:ABC-type Mn2+/Zn2+ transport system permease subunit
MDVIFSAVLTAVVVALYLFAYHRIFAITFDEEFAKSVGIKTGLYDAIFAAICSIVVVLGMRLLGSLLISSLIIFPTLTAMRLKHSFKGIVALSVIISIIAFVVQVICAIGFSMLNFGPEGLAHAMSISALFEVVVLLICENRDMNHQLLNKTFWQSMLKILIASVLTGFVSYFITKLLPLRAVDKSFFSVFPKFCAIVGGSVITYIGIGALLGIDEAKTVVKKIASILFKNVNVK